jgi:phosphoenolpyruvate carboxylase
MKTVAKLRDRLRKLHERTAETPLFNPVFQLSHDLSRELETGALSLDDMESLVAELECEALQSRAGRLRRLVAPTNPDENLARVAALLDEEDGFSSSAPAGKSRCCMRCSPRTPRSCSIRRRPMP